MTEVHDSHAIDPDRVVWTRPPHEADGRDLVVLLHGYGSDARDILNIAPYLPTEFVYASLRAPRQTPPPGLGFQWFPLRFDEADPGSVAVDERALELLARGASNAADAVADWIEDLEAADIRPARIMLLGFSQGAIVAWQTLRRHPERIAAVVGIAGLVSPDPQEGDELLAASRPPVYWGRGLLDAVIPGIAIRPTRDWLEAHTSLVLHEEPGLGHEFSLDELEGVSAFLREHSVSSAVDDADGADARAAADERRGAGPAEAVARP